MLRTIPIEEFLLCCHGEPLPSARRSDHTASPVGSCISGRETTRLCCFHGCLFACCLKSRFAERGATRYEREGEEAEEKVIIQGRGSVNCIQLTGTCLIDVGHT
jgi:hypothetical protein